ncbi:2-hydroxyacid dehydrogenase [Gracilibacillus dipsosauri]|uniref:Bifunctional glyoxylate/hydroxypyruvate reductase B n=1 Tax=Gracilibacillus dipsosauri TaxID=178340 RepID=A0A317L0C3_9BACI|nr:D-glycerate dehydrogenase [Gracilibacillus dipsosauri]PWU69065.1 bifunctional glyoxylate/hydroxypyruvate reductase B [Gracilibacillus dipsosauri]
MKKRVLVTEQFPSSIIQFLEQEVEVEYWGKPDQMPRELLLKKAVNIHGLITGKDQIDQALIEASPKLEVVSNVSVGYDNFDVEAIKNAKLLATHTPYVLDETVADLIFGLIMATSRRITELDQYVKQGKWKFSLDKTLFGTDVHHKKLGIIGMGRIGEKVARRARLGFEMEVAYFNRHRKQNVEKDLNIRYEEMDALLESSDFILLLTPLTKETYHLIGADCFHKMKKTAFFINAGRGPVVDEKALVEALRQNEIAGAGLDVFEQEPTDPNNPLLQMKNVVTLPHTASATMETRNQMKWFAAKNMLQGLKGEKPDALIKELQ